jgi:hypothetical protein
MAQKWYQKASVQAAMVGAVAIVLGAAISPITSRWLQPQSVLPLQSGALPPQTTNQIEGDLESNLAEFRVIDKTTVIDLRTMKYIPEENLTERYSYVNLYHYIRVETPTSSAKLRLPYKTGGSGLEVATLTHPFRVFKSATAERNLAGSFKILRLLEIDIPGQDTSREALVINAATYWNAFEKFPRYGMISNLQEKPQSMAITVIFPSDIPFPEYRIFRIVGGERTNSLDHVAYENTEANTLNVRVGIDEQFVEKTYVVEWDYLPNEQPNPRVEPDR